MSRVKTQQSVLVYSALGQFQTLAMRRSSSEIDPKRIFALVATAFPTARSAAPEHQYVRSNGGIPKPVKRSHISVEQVAIAAVQTLDDSVAAAGAADPHTRRWHIARAANRSLPRPAGS